MKYILAIMLLITWPCSGQVNWYGAAQVDPAILFDSNRVGGGNLNYIVRSGVEANNFTASILYESFNEIAFQAFALNLGVYKQFGAFTVTTTFEQGWISRNGILDKVDTADFKREEYIPYYIGGNASVKYAINQVIAFEYTMQFRQRPDIDYFFNQRRSTTLSGFLGVVVSLVNTNH